MITWKRFFLPLILIAVGLLFIVSAFIEEDVVVHEPPPIVGDSLIVLMRAGVPTSSLPVMPDDTYLHDLLDRALWEAEGVAAKAARAARNAMLEQSEMQDRSFLETVYELTSAREKIAKGKEAHKRLLVDALSEELNQNDGITEYIEAVIFQYLHDLHRIEQEVFIRSGVDVKSFPEMSLTVEDFESFIREGLHGVMGGFSESLQRESRVRTAIQTSSVAISVGVGFFFPTPFLLDLSVGLAAEHAIDRYRDANVRLEADLNRAMELLADHICFGTEEKPGLYAAFLDLAYYHNRQMSVAISNFRHSDE